MVENYSLTDIATATGNNKNNGWGNDWSSWIILFLIFAIFGWGGRGMGGFGGGMTGGGVQDGYVLASDMARVQQTITSGLCDGFYSTAQLINGVQMQNANNTAALQSTLCQGFSGLNNNINTQGYETRIGINGMGQQMAQCCCDIREGIAGVNYNNAIANAGLQKQIGDTGFGIERQIERGFCDTGYAMNTNTTAIVQNTHNDADRILARIDKMESDRQAERIAQLQSDNSMLKSQIYHDGNVRWLYEKLGPSCPQAAYVVQPPQQVTFPTNCCGGVNYASAGGCGCAG